MLRDVDTQYLEGLGLTFSTYEQDATSLLVIEGYPLPAGYSPSGVDLLIQIPSAYPDAALDMWWTYPHVVFELNGVEPTNANVRLAFSGFTPDPSRQWQRFSRHPQWRAGVDDLRSFLTALRSTMGSEAKQVAA